MLESTRNVLYAALQRHAVLFGLGLGVAATVAGLLGGVGAELMLLGAMVAWMGWEARPNFYFSLGLHEHAARVARRLAAGAGPSLRGDVHRLTEAASLLTLGEVDGAKRALAEIDPDRLPPRGRFVHFLNLSALFCRLGDGEGALAMVEASQAEAEELRAGWRGLPAINRAAALCELGRFDEAAAGLRRFTPARLPPGAQSYYFNNLAWSLALGSGDKAEALELARKAVALRSRDPGCLGTLGVAMILAGCEDAAALPHLALSLERRERRSPHGSAVLMAVSAQAYRAVGRPERAEELEQALRALPCGARSLTQVRAALEAAGRPLLLPEET